MTAERTTLLATGPATDPPVDAAAPPDGRYQAILARGTAQLIESDPELVEMLDREAVRQDDSLIMVASCSVTAPAVLASLGSSVANVTAEGYPGHRFHAGCAQVDRIEQLAIDRACDLFGATFANVQPHSASVANHLVFCGLLEPGDTILGMRLHDGGHLTHGSRASMSGQYFDAVGYGLGSDGRIDYGEVAGLAAESQPKLIVCGATAHSRPIDFERFRAIADDVGAILVADISHVAGLVVAGLHPSPIDAAHVTTSCTHKQLYGPRGGIILSGRDADQPLADDTSLRQRLQRSVFPFFQGAPVVNAIAAKAACFAWCGTADFLRVAQAIVDDARALAASFSGLGYHVVSGGTDNHTVILDLTERGLSGLVAEQALESVGIVVNKNHVPGDQRSAMVTSGLRLGTNTLAYRGARPDDIRACADLIHQTLEAVEPDGDTAWQLPPDLQARVAAEVRALARSLPIKAYG